MPKRIMREFKIGEISGVDRPAQKGALAVIMKRNGDAVGKNGAAITTEANGHTHLMSFVSYGGNKLLSGTTDYAHEGEHWHDHPWIMMESGQIVIGASNGHTHEVAVMNKQEIQEFGKTGVETLIKTTNWTNGMVKEAQHILDLAKGFDVMDLLASEEGVLADLLKDIASETQVGKKETPDMSKENKDAEALVDLQKKLDRSEAIGSMNDVTKAHFSTLEGEAADAFIAKSQDERSAEVDAIAKAAEDKDPVVYKTADGLEIRKSAGAVMVALAKKADEQEAINKGLVEAASTSDLEKRAAELTNIPGDKVARIAMLKAIDGIEDEAVRKAALGALVAQNDKLASAFETVGKQGGSITVPGSADEDLEKMAKAYQEKNPGVTDAIAMDAVLRTDQGIALYNKSVN